MAQKNKFDEFLKNQLIDQVYASYCDHLAAGFSKDNWYYEKTHKGRMFTLCYRTLKSWLLEHGDMFCEEKREIAWAKGYQFWEKLLIDSAKGINKARTASLQMIMRNKYGWDKNLQTDEDSAELLDAHLKVIKPFKEETHESTDTSA